MSGLEADRPVVSVALELSEIRRSVDVGFSRINGQLALVLQRADQSDRALDKMQGEVDELRREVEDLKRGRWPLPAVGALTGLAGLSLAAVPLLSR